jgi:hypothetical protein
MMNGLFTRISTLSTILSNLGCFKYIFIALPLLLNSCCTKEDCVFQVTEDISFSFNHNPSVKGFTEQEIDSMVVVLKNPVTGETIDSLKIREFNSGLSFPDTVHGFNEIDLKREHKTALGADIIIHLKGGSFADTLFNVQFESGVAEFKCSNCLFTDNTERIPFITNRSVTHRGQRFTERDFPLVISKK